jgi:hypothetical protein
VSLAWVDVELHDVIAANLGSGCSHEPVCLAVHRTVAAKSPTSDHYCCRATGSLCEAVYDGYYDGIRTGDRVGEIHRSVVAWMSEAPTAAGEVVGSIPR